MVLAACLLPALAAGCSTRSYSARPRSDGGVSLKIDSKRQLWYPVTAEGPFPRQEIYYDLDVVGPGKVWKYREGFYYSPSDIVCKSGGGWDFGFAWMDPERKHITFRLYWARGPDVHAANINGRYLTERAKPGGAASPSLRVGPATNRPSGATGSGR